jgi:hypothetical protein
MTPSHSQDTPLNVIRLGNVHDASRRDKLYFNYV